MSDPLREAAQDVLDHWGVDGMAASFDRLEAALAVQDLIIDEVRDEVGVSERLTHMSDLAIEANVELLLLSIRELVPDGMRQIHKWDNPKSSYDPLLRESRVLRVVVEHFSTRDTEVGDG